MSVIYGWWDDGVMAKLRSKRLPQPIVALELEGEMVTMGVTAITLTPNPPPLDAPWIYLGRGTLLSKRIVTLEV